MSVASCAVLINASRHVLLRSKSIRASVYRRGKMFALILQLLTNKLNCIHYSESVTEEELNKDRTT